MNEQELRDTLIQVLTEIAPETDPAALDPSADLADQLDIDSIDFLGVVVAVHNRTGIEIPERDYPKLATLDGAVAYLLAARQRGGGGPA